MDTISNIYNRGLQQLPVLWCIKLREFRRWITWPAGAQVVDQVAGAHVVVNQVAGTQVVAHC